ncbi:MAG: nitroreductase family protein [Clostridia bacterium]|nr:nitroreductase family protein [Clostridia bacterium]
MNVYEAIMQRRTIRKFKQEPIDRDILIKLIDCARVAAYGANMQPLKFAVIDDAAMLKDIYPLTKWAGALADGAPREGERPVAYIAVLCDKNIRPNGAAEVEVGAAVTTMMLEAEEMGLATCWLGAIQRDKIKQVLKLAPKLDVLYLLALGYPMQKSRMVEMTGGDVKYYESEDGTINVPKRSLDEVIVTL